MKPPIRDPVLGKSARPIDALVEHELEVLDEIELVELLAADPASWERPKIGGREVALVAAKRSDALALTERAHAAGFARVLYRDTTGKLWDPMPPGDWVTES